MFLCDLDGYTRRSSRKPKLTLEQLEGLLRTFLLEVYHKRASSEGRLAPSERWEHGGFLPRMPEFLEQLDLLLMQEIRARKVRRDGIHFQSLRYLSLTLAAYVGEDVTNRFDPRDMGEIRVFHRDRFLCLAISSELAGETIPLRTSFGYEIDAGRNCDLSSTTTRSWSTHFCNSNKVRSRRKSMQLPLSQQAPQSASNATGTTNGSFIETVEYDRFIEFCDTCRRCRYICLCYGPPGVGKTLSAFRYSRREMIVSFDRWTSTSRDQLPINTILYTTSVTNTPSRVEADIGMARERLMGIAMNPIRLEAKEVLDAIRLRDEARRREI
jgi:hypothetical protein